ncbi:hypothetical protein niasHT_006728 [Heterodera trifolii]|uniref:Uncharacterized protein n=1 Tax=Heterodera trifolii TaxID=157864 RepID=A0ABD2LWL8_9BILA
MNDSQNDVSECCFTVNCLQSAKKTTAMGATKPKVPPKPKGLNKMVERRENNRETTAEEEARDMPEERREERKNNGKDNGRVGKKEEEEKSDQRKKGKQGERSDQRKEDGKDRDNGRFGKREEEEKSDQLKEDEKDKDNGRVGEREEEEESDQRKQEKRGQGSDQRKEDGKDRDNGRVGKREDEEEGDQREKPEIDQRREDGKDENGGMESDEALAEEMEDDDNDQYHKRGKGTSKTLKMDTKTEEKQIQCNKMLNEHTEKKQQKGQRTVEQQKKSEEEEKATEFDQNKTKRMAKRTNSIRRPKCKPPLPAKPKEWEEKNAEGKKGAQNDSTGGAKGVLSECQTALSFPSPITAKVRKPSARPPPPPVDKMHRTTNVVPKPPANPPPPPPKQWTPSNGGDQQNSSIYEEIGDEKSEGEIDDSGSEIQLQIVNGKVPKCHKRTGGGHLAMDSHFRKSGGRERDGRRKTTQLEQWGQIKGRSKGDKGEEEEKSREQQEPMTSTFFSSASPSVCCCSVCLNSSPLLSRSMFLPSPATISSPAISVPSPPLARHRSRIVKSEIIEQKLGRYSNELRLNLNRGMDKIRFRMALLNTRHCPSAHFCSIGKKLFAQQDNVKNFASMRRRNGNKSEGTAPIEANGKSTFYVSGEEEEAEDEEEEEEEDEFGDDWSTSSGGSEAEEERKREGTEQEQYQQQMNMNRECFPSASIQSSNRPSLWEEIETEYQKRKRQRRQAAENFPHLSMDSSSVDAVEVQNECALITTTTTSPSTDAIPKVPMPPILCLSGGSPVRSSPSPSGCPSSDSVVYSSQLPIQQPLYQIYYLRPAAAADPLRLASSSSPSASISASDTSSSVLTTVDEISSAVAPLRLETIAELSGWDSQSKCIAGGDEQRGTNGRGTTRNEQDKVEETDSVCNDPTDIASVSSSSAVVNIRRHSSTASSSADSGRADSLSRISSYPSTPNTLPVRRERLLGGSKYGSQRSLWCELPEVKEAGLLDQLDDGQKKLQEAYFEVITSEASYLRSLSFLISHFMSSPELLGSKSDRSIITTSERKHLFSNIVAIRDCSERLLCDLETRLKDSLVLSELCDILCDYYECHFSPYISYCSNQVYQDRTLKALKSSNSLFLACIQRLETDRQCQGLDMRSFLMLPMQRITRYPLLIFAIRERLHPDKIQHSVATRALTLANQASEGAESGDNGTFILFPFPFVHNCNEGARKMAQTEQLLEIDAKVVYRGSELRRVPLVSSGRYLVKSGSLSQLVVERRGTSALKTRHLMLFLFSDLLLVTKGRTNGTFICKDYALRRFVFAEPLEANDARVPLRALHAIGSSSSNLHLILCTLAQNARGNQQVELLLNADSESDRERWLTAMRPPTCANTEDKIYSEWDCPQALAVHNYAIQQEDELSLSKGDVVNILRKMTDGWFYGERTRDAQMGWFPSSYVQQVLNDHNKANSFRQKLSLVQQRSSAGDSNVFRRGSSLQAIAHDGGELSFAHSPHQRDHPPSLSRLRRMSSPFGVLSRDA